MDIFTLLTSLGFTVTLAGFEAAEVSGDQGQELTEPASEGGDGNEQGQHTGEQPISSQTAAGKPGYTCILIGSLS